MDFSNLTIATAHALLTSRETSAVELTEAALARIDALDPRIKSFLLVDYEGAL